MNTGFGRNLTRVQSAFHWWQARQRLVPRVLPGDQTDLNAKVQSMSAEGFDVVFIDTQPIDASESLDAANHSDVILVPHHYMQAAGNVSVAVQGFLRKECTRCHFAEYSDRGGS